MPRWVHAQPEQEGDSEPESSESEPEEGGEEEGEEEDAQGEAADEAEGAAGGAAQRPAIPQSRPGQVVGPKNKITISLKKGQGQGQQVCHVCGKRGHNAGFVGSVYMDCPNKPCYLCKQTGHTTATCPHRIAPEHGCSVASHVGDGSFINAINKREKDGRKREVELPRQRWVVDAAVLKLHSRRCTCLAFHPTKDNIVVSGDKKGQVAVWDYDKVHERTLHRPNQALTNNMAFLPGGDGMTCASASADGTVKVFDVESGFAETLLDLNPDGWVDGVTDEKSWRMLYGLDVSWPLHLVLAGDSLGRLHLLDPRQAKPANALQLHKKDKIVSVNVNPADGNLILTASNDHTARISDMRLLSSEGASTSAAGGNKAKQHPAQVASMAHPKVVNSANFSPVTGNKILTTCIDNRLRVWDYIYSCDGPPDREIVHSHEFNRYLTPFRAEWDPKDPFERRIVVGRYISEDYSGIALHPIDILDASTGRSLSVLCDPNLTTICPVNKPHPRRDLIISGSSRSLYAWTPAPEDAEEAGTSAAAQNCATTFELKGSETFVFYDAEEVDATKKKKRASSNANAPDSADAKKKKKR